MELDYNQHHVIENCTCDFRNFFMSIKNEFFINLIPRQEADKLLTKLFLCNMFSELGYHEIDDYFMKLAEKIHMILEIKEKAMLWDRIPQICDEVDYGKSA